MGFSYRKEGFEFHFLIPPSTKVAWIVYFWEQQHQGFHDASNQILVPFADYSDAELGAVISLVKHGGLTGALERFMDAEGKPPTHTPSTAEAILFRSGIGLVHQIPSGNLTVGYWKWPLIVDFPIKNGDFP